MDVEGRAPGRRDLVGSLVDYPEAHVFQDRHPLGERNRLAEVDELEADARPLGAGGTERHEQRRHLRQAGEDGDIGNRHIRREVIAVGGRERLLIARQQGVGAVVGVEQVAEAIAPGADQRRHPGLQLGARRRRRLAAGAADDEVDAGKRHRLRKGRVSRLKLLAHRRPAAR